MYCANINSVGSHADGIADQMTATLPSRVPVNSSKRIVSPSFFVGVVAIIEMAEF
jgi:hypothetical protein